MRTLFDRTDRCVIDWANEHGVLLLRLSLAVIYIWFGILKPFHLSPASQLAADTVYWIPADIFVPLLGWCEVAIGVGILIRPLLKLTLILMLLHMAGTFMPFAILPEDTFTQAPYVLTLTGQYVLKNLIMVSAMLVIAGSLRGDRRIESPARKIDPDRAQEQVLT